MNLIHAFRIPGWATNVFDPFSRIATFEGFNSVGSREMTRISTGFLLREIIERFRSKIGGSLKPDRNLWVYSAHDITITSIMTLLNIRDVSIQQKNNNNNNNHKIEMFSMSPQSEHPPYAASLCLELYENGGQYFVQIVYKKDNNENSPPLEIPGCGQFCPLNIFHQLYQPFLPMADFETECKMN